MWSTWVSLSMCLQWSMHGVFFIYFLLVYGVFMWNNIIRSGCPHLFQCWHQVSTILWDAQLRNSVSVSESPLCHLGRSQLSFFPFTRRSRCKLVLTSCAALVINSLFFVLPQLTMLPCTGLSLGATGGRDTVGSVTKGQDVCDY